MDKKEIKTFNIITLGDCGVGKSSIINRFINNAFDENISSTVGINFSKKEMTLSKKDKIILKLVDITGQEKFRALTRSYFKNAEAVLFVFSMNDKNTFDTIADWIKLFKENNRREEAIPKYLVGNKNDLEIKVEQNLIDELVQVFNIPFISISAKDNKSIDKLFEEVGNKLYLGYIRKGNQQQNNIKIGFNIKKSKDCFLCTQY